jgi:hypothetical protein
MAGNVGGERQLTGITNLDDSFRAASSVDRLARADPELSAAPRESTPESRHSHDAIAGNRAARVDSSLRIYLKQD